MDTQLKLFEEISPVSEAEVSAWLDSVPNLSKAVWRREAYRKAWHVEEKILAAKNQWQKPSKPKTPSRGQM